MSVSGYSKNIPGFLSEDEGLGLQVSAEVMDKILNAYVHACEFMDTFENQKESIHKLKMQRKGFWRDGQGAKLLTALPEDLG